MLHKQSGPPAIKLAILARLPLYYGIVWMGHYLIITLNVICCIPQRWFIHILSITQNNPQNTLLDNCQTNFKIQTTLTCQNTDQSESSIFNSGSHLVYETCKLKTKKVYSFLATSCSDMCTQFPLRLEVKYLVTYSLWSYSYFKPLIGIYGPVEVKYRIIAHFHFQTLE